MEVGWVEESAKIAALGLGLVLTLPELFRLSSSAKRGSCRCFRGCCRVLLESREALLVGGLACGFGFMIVENAEYFLLAAAEPTTCVMIPGALQASFGMSRRTGLRGA